MTYLGLTEKKKYFPHQIKSKIGVYQNLIQILKKSKMAVLRPIKKYLVQGLIFNKKSNENFNFNLKIQILTIRANVVLVCRVLKWMIKNKDTLNGESSKMFDKLEKNLIKLGMKNSLNAKKINAIGYIKHFGKLPKENKLLKILFTIEKNAN
ncbi:hypothetical protein [Chryseobacterium sp.]|uniref:hypothetical protein n=1 Tax=Chryseobacterium sp. TaxID=1871047 RepID=UPI0032195F03